MIHTQKDYSAKFFKTVILYGDLLQTVSNILELISANTLCGYEASVVN